MQKLLSLCILAAAAACAPAETQMAPAPAPPAEAAAAEAAPAPAPEPTPAPAPAAVTEAPADVPMTEPTEPTEPAAEMELPARDTVMVDLMDADDGTHGVAYLISAENGSTVVEVMLDSAPADGLLQVALVAGGCESPTQRADLFTLETAAGGEASGSAILDVDLHALLAEGVSVSVAAEGEEEGLLLCGAPATGSDA